MSMERRGRGRCRCRRREREGKIKGEEVREGRESGVGVGGGLQVVAITSAFAESKANEQLLLVLVWPCIAALCKASVACDVTGVRNVAKSGPAHSTHNFVLF